jgi:hypothetical protein
MRLPCILFILNAKKKYIQNFFTPLNPEKYIGDLKNIVYRSSYELKAFHWCDTQPNVLQWSSETIQIRYFDPTSNKIRRYFPDLFVKIQEQTGDIKKYILEIKPKRQTVPPKQSSKKRSKTYLTEMKTYEKNLAKWIAAENFCLENGITFKIISEKELGL